MKTLQPLFRILFTTTEDHVEVIQWGESEEFGRRAIVVLRRKGAPLDGPLPGIAFDEEDPGRFCTVKLALDSEGEWQCEYGGAEGRSRNFVMTSLRLAAEAGHRLDWPLWTIFLKAQNELGWDGKNIARVLVVSARQAQSILAQSMVAAATPAEA